MDNNEELTSKLEREIWLFEQWLTSIEGQQGETHARIRAAYEECIDIRRTQLAQIELSKNEHITSELLTESA